MQFSKADKVFFETLQLRPYAFCVGLSSDVMRKKLVFTSTYYSKGCHSPIKQLTKNLSPPPKKTKPLLSIFFSFVSNLLFELWIFLDKFKDVKNS